MQGITDLVLSYATSLAGFEVTTYGRFSGDHRGLRDIFRPVPSPTEAGSSKFLIRRRPVHPREHHIVEAQENA
jgi:hypothetical protein